MAKPKPKQLSPRTVQVWGFIISILIAWLLYQLPAVGHP